MPVSPRLLPPLGLALLLVLTAPALAGEDQSAPQVTVTGLARQELTPDQARISLGVRSLAASPQEASRHNAAAMQAILKAVKPLLRPEDHLQTQTYSLIPQREWDQKARRWREVGFQAENRVRVTTRRPDLLGELIQAASQAGANLIEGPQWGLSDPAQARRQTQILALADARAQAEALAQAAGLSLGPVRSISASASEPPTPLLMRSAAAENADANPAPPLEPGRIGLSASVTVSFGLLTP